MPKPSPKLTQTLCPASGAGVSASGASCGTSDITSTAGGSTWQLGWCRLKMLKLICWQKGKRKNVADLHHSNIVQTEFMNSDHVDIIPQFRYECSWWWGHDRLPQVSVLGGKAHTFARLCHSVSHDLELDNNWSWNKIRGVSTGLSGILYPHVENMQRIISYSSPNERWGAWRQDK